MAAISSLSSPTLLHAPRLRLHAAGSLFRCASSNPKRRTLASRSPAGELIRDKMQLNILLSRNALYELSQCHRTRCFIPYAINMSAGDSDGTGKLDTDGIISALGKLWDGLPQPVKNFPWNIALMKFCHLIFELTLEVAKYLCIPLLAISSLSEMSYCAHERKMSFIPIPFLAGLAVAGGLRDTAVELSPDIKHGGFPVHLLVIWILFMLLKLPGPYYPYWGRVIIPHFANGGLWRVIWSTVMWYRSSKQIPVVKSEASLSENSSKDTN